MVLISMDSKITLYEKTNKMRMIRGMEWNTSAHVTNKCVIIDVKETTPKMVLIQVQIPLFMNIFLWDNVLDSRHQ